MTWRGLNLLAVFSGILLLSALIQSIAAILTESWWLMADAGVCGVVGLGFGVLAVLEDVL